MENELIVLKQAPVIIYQKIESVGQEVEKRISELNLENLIVTEDSISAVKKTRTKLNKEFEVFEAQRKMIKEAVAKPYKEFEDKYKEFIANNYKNADETLKVKINHFEIQLKEDKENEVKEYFTELCQNKGIDFINFSKTGLKITLSTSLKSLKDQINTFVEAREKELQTLESIPESDDFKNQVLFEYKKTLDMPRSLRLVQERQKALKEAEARKLEEEAKRRAEIETQKQAETPQSPNVPLSQSAPLTAPTVEEVQQLLEVQFKVRGTREQLKALKEFIISNNIEILE